MRRHGLSLLKHRSTLSRSLLLLVIGQEPRCESTPDKSIRGHASGNDVLTPPRPQNVPEGLAVRGLVLPSLRHLPPRPAQAA